MATYEVCMSSGSKWRQVDVPDYLPEHIGCAVALAVVGHAAFSARPLGCSGLSSTNHLGMEQACPVHCTHPGPGEQKGMQV